MPHDREEGDQDRLVDTNLDTHDYVNIDDEQAGTARLPGP
jgi:hypothetical protein